MIRKLMASSAIIALMSAGAVTSVAAQDNPAKPPVQNETTAAQQPASGDKALHPSEPTLATVFIGRSVYSSADPNSDNIGDVNDLIVSEDGTITQAVIGVGGFLGIGEKNVAVPFEQLQVVEDSESGDIKLIYSATRDQLEAAPDFDRTAYDPVARHREEQAAAQSTGTAGTAPLAPMGGMAPAADNTVVGGTAAPAPATTDQMASNSQAAATAPAAQDFVNTAAVANMFEIQSSQLARDKAESQDVKDFAARMITDHTKAGDDMKAAVSQANAGITVPDALDQPHTDQLSQLQQASGADFDRQYVDMQVKAHDEAVALFTAYADGGDNPALKDFANNTLPTLKDHQQMIHQIASSNMASSAGGNGQPAAAMPADQMAAGTPDNAAPAAPAAGEVSFLTATPDQIRGSELVGQSVYSGENESIGKISDLVLEPGGTTRQALVDVGGFLGVGSKTVAIPFDQLQISKDDQGNAKVTVAMTKDQLNQQPAIDVSSATGTGAPATSNQTAETNAPAAGGQPMDSDTVTTGSIGTAGAPGQNIAATSLMGAAVNGPDDSSLGKVGDIVFDKTGQIQGVVVDVGGFLGIGAKPVGIEFNALDIRRDENGTVTAMVNATKDQLNNAPSYEPQTSGTAQ